jgi:hypothetical protein
MRYPLKMSLAAALGVVSGLGNLSCSKIDCGEGTVERDGVCFPADEQPDVANCGPGTVLGSMGCEVETPTQCDPVTTSEQFDPETGLTTCVGVSGGCDLDLPCTAPMAGRTSLCGRLYDTETDLPLAPAPGATGTRCNPAAPATDGPCALEIKAYDALAFAENPTGATPLVVPDGIYLDDCGRYKAINIPGTTFGFVGLAVDEAAGVADAHRLTGVATDEDFARPAADFRAYTTRISTDMAWTTSAGLTGMTFAQRGVLAIIFHRDAENDAPVAGVSLRRGTPATLLDNTKDFYFSDVGIARTTIADPVANPAAVDMTGANGTVLAIDAPQVVAHDGVGGLPATCQWPSNLAAAIPGAVFVQIKHAEMPGGAACP